MSFCDFHWFSNVLGKQVASYVLLPDSGKPPFPVFYLLHGLSDDHTAWMRWTRIEIYARQLPLIVVMPDGFRGFYTNNTRGPAFAKYLGEELPAVIERSFPARTSGRAARCIGGLSMGGYGALRIGLEYASRYASITSHSGALDNPPERLKQFMPEEMYEQIFGEKYAGSEHDLALLARRARSKGRMPKIRIDCGTEDFLLTENRRFHSDLQRLKVPHEYEEFPGGHTWDYWDRHVQTALKFHATALRLSAAK